MAGKKQHTLPKFLLKGFASKVGGKKNRKVLVWWYHKNHKPKEISTDDFARTDNFYGESVLDSVDDKITKQEFKYSKLIQTLRTLAKDSQVHDILIPEFIAHLSVRTKHIRDVFTDFSSDFLETLFGFLTNSESLSVFMNDYIKNHPEIITTELEKLFAPEIASLLRPFIPTQYRPESFSDFTEQIKQAGKKSIEKIPESIKDGHLKSLEKSIAPEARIKFYEQMNWFILTSTSPLILGDFGCLAETNEERKLKVIPYELEGTESIFLPISKDKILIGTKSSKAPSINFDEINEATAKCSREFFISALFSAEFEKLQSAIGTYSDFDSNKEIKKIMDDIKNI